MHQPQGRAHTRRPSPCVLGVWRYASISRNYLGQPLLRQLPFFGQFFFIDALFALFTERRQRAFELLTKTRAVGLSTATSPTLVS